MSSVASLESLHVPLPSTSLTIPMRPSTLHRLWTDAARLLWRRYRRQSPEQAVKLRQCLSHIDELEAHRKEIEQEISQPFSAVLDLLYTLPGLGKNPMTAIAILSEIGPDMSVFLSSKPLVSWAGCCPRNNQSNSKVKSRRISTAGSYLKPILVQVANALIKSKKHPEFKERYHRIKSHRGHKKAVIAVCKMLLTAIWNMLSKLEPYNPSGFLEHRPVNEKKVLTKPLALEFLRLRGYTITDVWLPLPDFLLHIASLRMAGDGLFAIRFLQLSSTFKFQTSTYCINDFILFSTSIKSFCVSTDNI